jgi:anti-sigma B factor antagonist
MARSLPSVVQEIRWEGRRAVVRVAGDVDLSRCVEFQQQLLAILDERPERVVVDISGVPYMDSSGIASLVKVLSRARKNGAGLVLAGLSERVKSLFQITRLDQVFQIAADPNDAIK